VAVGVKVVVVVVVGTTGWPNEAGNWLAAAAYTVPGETIWTMWMLPVVLKLCPMIVEGLCLVSTKKRVRAERVPPPPKFNSKIEVLHPFEVRTLARPHFAGPPTERRIEPLGDSSTREGTSDPQRQRNVPPSLFCGSHRLPLPSGSPPVGCGQHPRLLTSTVSVISKIPFWPYGGDETWPTIRTIFGVVGRVCLACPAERVL
jgi:hypothetical protein